MIKYNGNKYSLREGNFDIKLREAPFNSIDICLYIMNDKNNYSYIDEYDAIVFEVVVDENEFINNTEFLSINNNGKIEKSDELYIHVSNILNNNSLIDILECIDYMYLYRTDLDSYSQIRIKDLEDELLKSELKEELKKFILEKFM